MTQGETLMKDALAPIDEPFNPEIQAILDQYPKGKDGYILRLFRVFANSLRFLKHKGVVNLLDRGSPLSLREREIVILRVTANKDCEYEWGVHVAVFAEAAGLSDQQVSSTRLGTPDEGCWDARESLLLTCVDDLCRHAKIQDDSYAQFQESWNMEQQLEILALCGNYHTVSFVANTARVAQEEFAASFPARHESR